MGRSKPSIARCPRCNRTIRTNDLHYVQHNEGEHNQLCPMSFQHTPIVGNTPSAYRSRASLVANLAEQIQDSDPTLVWDYLTALSGNELQRMMMVALAAIPVDQTLDEMFAWVCELPVAKAVTA